MEYQTVELNNTSDFKYLKSCGLNPKGFNHMSKTCKVPSVQYDMAQDFVRGRELARELRNIRKDQQSKIDRMKAFNEL